jgi:uncharacterized protein with von Willebrand factor type A (vWA) domain
MAITECVGAANGSGVPVIADGGVKFSGEVQHGIPLLSIAAGAREAPDEAGRNTSGAQAVERLQSTDFTQVPLSDQQQLEQLVLRLCRQMSLRLARRQRAARRRGPVDLRRTIRRSIATGGDPIDLRYRRRKPRKPRLVALLDVSGSMDRYSCRAARSHAA